MADTSTIPGRILSASTSIPLRVGSSTGKDQCALTHLERERDALRYADFEMARLPWWRRWPRRLERVFELNK